MIQIRVGVAIVVTAASSLKVSKNSELSGLLWHDLRHIPNR